MLGKTMSLICQQDKDGSIYAIEIKTPMVITDIARILTVKYRTPQDVRNLINMGSLSYFDVDSSNCVPLNENDKGIQRYFRKNFTQLLEAYPYIYLYDNELERWHFCKKQTETYFQHPCIPLQDAVKLNNEGKLFSLPI